MDNENEDKVKTDDGKKKDSRIYYDLISQLIEHLHSTKGREEAILIFLPGIMEIKKCIHSILSRNSANQNEILLLPLHSSLSPYEQSKVFLKPKGHQRKIVVATNVAETSITM